MTLLVDHGVSRTEICRKSFILLDLHKQKSSRSIEHSLTWILKTENHSPSINSQTGDSLQTQKPLNVEEVGSPPRSALFAKFLLLVFPQRERLHIWTEASVFWVFGLPIHPEDFRFARLHNHVCPFLTINLPLSVYIFYCLFLWGTLTNTNTV